MQTAGNVVLITGPRGTLASLQLVRFKSSAHEQVLVNRSQERLKELFRELADSPQHLLAGGVDLSDAGSLSKLVNGTMARFGRIYAPVHTVGSWRGGKPVHETDLADWTSFST